MSNVQFHHKRRKTKYAIDLFDNIKIVEVLEVKGGETFAVEVPSRTFFEIAKQNRESNVVITYGKAVCSKDDNYCKSTGRKFAYNRLQDTVFKFSWIQLNDGTEKYFLIRDDVVLMLKTHGNRIYFIEAT